MMTVKSQTSPTSLQGNSSFLYCSELAYVHIDREVYVAGENMFFKLYVTPCNNLKSGQISSIGYITLRNQKMNILNLIVKLKGGSSFGYIYIPDTLKSGMYELVAFTNYMKNFDESIYFRKELLIVNRFDKTLDEFYSRDSGGVIQKPLLINTSSIQNTSSESLRLILQKDSFKTREKIRVGIQWNNNKLKQGLLNSSLTVRAITPLTHIPIEPITVVADTLKTAEGKNQFWNKDPYYPEENGVYIKGQISSIDSKLLKEQCLFISTFDTIANLQYTFSNDSGKFQFLLDNYYIGKSIVLKIWENDNNSGKKIELEDKFAFHNSFIPRIPEMNVNLKKYIFSSQDLVQINKMYHAGKNLLYEPETKSEKVFVPSLFFNPGTVVDPSNYIPLDNFSEITANILRGFVLRKSKGIYNVFLFDNLTKAMFDKPAPIFLDGIYINNASQILSLNSDDIKKIEFCNSRRMKGILEFPGLVSIITREQKPDYSRYNSNALIFKIDGYSNKAYYQSTSYDKVSNGTHLPDFRQLLYWNPELNLKQGETSYIEFNSSDYISEYLVELRGFTSEGKPVSAYTRIKVYR
jgi:hypothetical protein